MSTIPNTTVLVTGAGTGIGQALTIELAKSGYNVIGIGRRQLLLEETKKYNVNKIHIIQADIALQEGRKKIFDEIEKLNPTALYLIHNAATIEPILPLKSITLLAFRETLATNLEAPLFLTQLLLPYLKNGRVLHISTGLAHFALNGLGAYAISKAALHMLYLCLRDELKEYDILVGSVKPGVVDTPMQFLTRNFNKNEFPSVEVFKNFEEKGKFIPHSVVASKLKWLLFETNNSDFSGKEWDISEIP